MITFVCTFYSDFRAVTAFLIEGRGGVLRSLLLSVCSSLLQSFFSLFCRMLCVFIRNEERVLSYR